MILKRIYLYPVTSRGRDEAQNPYINNLAVSLQKYFCVINREKPSNSGILQIIRFFFKTDILYLNWIENLPDKKAGKIQSILLVLLLIFLKLAKKKVVWTMHNKISHSKKNLRLKKFLFKLLLRLSDIVITHSKEGISYGKSIVPREKIFYFPHPVMSSEIRISNKPINKKYDILIWGLMVPYKGLSEFLKYICDRYNNELAICIIGKFLSEEYYNEVCSYKTSKIEIINKFAERNELERLMDESRAVLFTYKDDSVLSSGVLTDTLLKGALIIGPSTGSFKDLGDEGLIINYSDFGNLGEILKDVASDKIEIDNSKLEQFLRGITWEEYATFLKDTL